MNRKSFLTHIVLVQLALSGCANARNDASQPKIFLTRHADGTCSSAIDGKPFDMRDENAVRAAMDSYPGKELEVRIMDDMDMPYRCIGGLIYTLQKLGYPKISFISEPRSND